MNVDRMMKLADHIEHGVKDAQFDMREWLLFHQRSLSSASKSELDKAAANCGTQGCIAGHAVLLFRDDIKDDNKQHSIMFLAQYALGLDDMQRQRLFVPNSVTDMDIMVRPCDRKYHADCIRAMANEYVQEQAAKTHAE